jgi:hypothetical protein
VILQFAEVTSKQPSVQCVLTDYYSGFRHFSDVLVHLNLRHQLALDFKCHRLRVLSNLAHFVMTSRHFQNIQTLQIMERNSKEIIT